jgi:Mg/Co/Ni transporter MgtE
VVDPILEALGVETLPEGDSDFFGASTAKKKPPINPEYENPEDGYGDDYSDYANLNSQEKREKIRKLQIENESKLRTLIEKELVTAIFGEMSQSVRNNIVDQAKRKAKTWADLLGIPGKEREIEGLLSDLGEEEINGLMSDMERLVDEGVFE